jgi:hypothetical protein
VYGVYYPQRAYTIRVLRRDPYLHETKYWQYFKVKRTLALTESRLTSGAEAIVVVLSTLMIAFCAPFMYVSPRATASA